MNPLQPVAVAILYYRKNNEIFCFMQNRKNDLWEFPGGKIENKEAPQEALIRELKEEINQDFRKEELSFFGIYSHDVGDLKVILYAYLIKSPWRDHLFPLKDLPKTFEGNKPLIEDLQKYLYDDSYGYS